MFKNCNVHRKTPFTLYNYNNKFNLCFQVKYNIFKIPTVELSMMGDAFLRKSCQGGDCKVFMKGKVYNTTLTNHQMI